MFEFIKLREEHLEKVLNWRTKEDVTRYMITDIEYDLDKQIKWFNQITNNPSEKYWIICYNSVQIGLISLNDIDYKNKHTRWGYYIGEEEYRIYGGIIPHYLYNYVFGTLCLNKINAEVLEGNENVMKLNLLHGYRKVGVFKKHIYKNDKFYDLYLLELTKEDWKKANKRYDKYEAYFEI
ncbi:UDP-4-amino-4,6-dideoxy-N-acetyl-beta-L-altrosamine N-acetyltransferase [Tissierella praeacuta DSM 18095]|uniref:UDP-4-amino-4,6-dideoxy-N-acetyl-beta-L-altrosamine N-acetyltransferase n=1 Tax=Tissierella praeacuta DSM 18095 TaxID=1123404 RepID=A0A1M4X2B7_9FIRM|nr:UDP-4-amino-4,6-dideoxy-N-acetyl-beta-L-altrosamine N-acetyltransferase [Tissierella praeacuta]SHE87609.1 UDP-4-amino-4,6-dideoxy-N-acetyl-beta-L-altrosamine N-acetyltransferase [Tissierella praeacuta DSM 18095]SUO99651.1 pseudaminic acid biosynthesis N-acetyl transferase [Tissierella praeacuta]